MAARVYDDEQTKSDKNLGDEHMRRLTGISPDEEAAMEREARKGAAQDIAEKSLKPKDLERAEEEGARGGRESRGAHQEKEALPGSDDDQIGGGYKHDDKGKRSLRSRVFTRRNAIGGAVTGGIVGGAFALFSFLQGPLQIVHFAQLLQQFHIGRSEDFSDRRTGTLIYNYLRNKPERSRLGPIANKLADRFERRMQNTAGLRSIYDNSTGRLLGFEEIDPRKAQEFFFDTDFGDEFHDAITTHDAGNLPPHLRNAHAVTPNGRPTTITGRVYDLADLNIRQRRVFTRTVTKATNTTRKAGAIGSRLLIRRAGVDFHPLKNIQRKATDSFLDWRKRIKEERAERRRTGVDAPDVLDPAARNDQDTDGDGTPDSPDPEADAAAREARETLEEIGGVDAGKLDGQAGLQAIRNRLLVKVGGSVTAIVGVLCSVRSIGDQAENLQHANTILPMMRLGMEIVTTGNQVMTGMDVNVEELGTVIDDLYDEASETSWAAARSIQAELGNPLSGPDIPPSAKPSKVGDKPLIFDIIDSIPGIGLACGIDNTIGNLPGLKQAGDLAGGAINAVLGQFGISIEELIGSIVNTLAGNGANVFAQGAELGNLANYGARLATNDAFIAKGGRELSGTETAQLKAQRDADLRHAQRHKSFFAQVFDIYDANSAVSKAVIQNPDFASPKTAAAALVQAPTKLSSVIGFMLPGFNQKASAQSNYDYGFPEYGFSLSEQDDPRFQDPYANAEIVEPQLERLNSEYGSCFSTTIDPTSGAIVTGEAKRYDQIDDKCKDPNNEELLRYRFYLADTVTAKSLACFENIDEGACNELGFGNLPQQLPNNQQSANPNIYILGDSLTFGIQSAGLDSKLIAKGWKPTSRGLTSRRISGGVSPDGVTQITQDAAASGTAGVIVVALGTNHLNDSAAQFNAELLKMYDAIKALNSTAQIYWVNFVGVGMNGPKLAEKTALLEQFALSRNIRIIDWAGIGAPYLTSDPLGIHPNNYTPMVDLVVNAVGSPAVSTSAIVGDPYTDSTGVPCANGTRDLGVHDGYVDGRLFKVRLCSLSNLPSNGQADNPGGQFSTPGADGHAIVNSRVSGAWFALVNEAKSAGVSLSANSSFRSMPHQQSLWNNNPDSSLVARPGHSSHQAGVAIDFAGMSVTGGSTCATRARAPSSPGWVWLNANAHKYGFKQYSKEAWHWDALPVANRCGPS